MSTKVNATIEDLYQVHGKAELVNGEFILMPPTGDLPNRAGGSIYISLRLHEPNVPSGRAYSDNAGFKVKLPNRDSFSPDAAFYVGESSGMKFLKGAPVFAVEVRSENDYGPKAEKEIVEKIKDYFAAGTQVVWDVDLLGKDVVRKYLASDPDNPIVYRRGDVADAEPAVPGWRMPVEDLFR
ncbi:MAG: Uma2 family endonuclease [Acidobacteriota bacterium]|nr:Uma2 family endonuclease [Acidobacteriota bacterium]